MNVIQDNIGQIKKDFATNKPMIVKPTIIGNALMRPPSSATKKLKTPSSSHSRAKEAGSASKSTSSIHRDSHVIVAVCEGRGKATGIVGIAAVDIHRPVLILSQISDNQTYTATLTKLNILRPVEVLVPATFVEGASVSRLVTAILNHFPDLSVNSVPRSEFNRSRGIHIIQTLCAPVFSSVILQINQKFYASAASCALLRYIEQTRRVLYSPKTIKVEYQEPEHTTAIDIDTAYLLELVSNTGKQNVSLFTVLDYCSTKLGKKLLRNNILQPPCRKNIIETRQDCIEELIENPELLTRLQETLTPLFDIGASLTFGTVVPATASSVSERQLNYTLQLKGLLNAVQPLVDELKSTKHPVFKEIYNRIEGLDTRKNILYLISQVVNEDAHLGKGQAGELQRCFAIKSGINGFLDLSRRLYTEGVDNMRAYVDELTSTYNLPLRVHHTIKNGFHIILPLTKALRNLKQADLPPVFIKSERFSSHFYLNTMDMVNFDKRLKNNSTEIQNISNVIIYELLVDIRPRIGDLYNLCDDVAELDMLVSLARASSVHHWVRPRLVDTHMALEGARHPVLEHSADRELVTNSVYAYPRSNLHIITGPNMSGKTILLHSLCLTQILCQLGCWVPCSRATLRVSDRVIARFAEDETTFTGSSFALEAARLSYMLAMLSDTSLVVLDELCRTTSADEGVALAMAICEKMVKRGVFVFVASHYLSLSKLADMYPSVENWNMETLEEYRANNTRISLKFTYKLLPGVTSIDAYGIKLSRIFNSSTSISDRAEDLYKWLLPMRKYIPSESGPKSPEYLKFKLQSELDLLKIKNHLTDEILKDKITNFQNKTGLSFEPSPLTIERTNSNSLLNRTSSNEKKTSSNSTSAGKKLSSGSNSWVPTPSNKTTISSNHEFSVPTSNKSRNVNQDLADKHIFSFDNNDKNVPSTSYAPDENMSFADSVQQIGIINSFHSLEENDSNHSETVSNKNFLFCNSRGNETQSQNRNVTFFEFSDFKSYQKKLLESENSNKKSISQETNWSSAENTLINNNNRNTNLIVNSTPSTLKQKPSLPSENIINYTPSPNSQILSKMSMKTPTISKRMSSSSCQENSSQIQAQNLQKNSNSSIFKSYNSSSLSKIQIRNTPSLQNISMSCEDNTTQTQSEKLHSSILGSNISKTPLPKQNMTIYSENNEPQKHSSGSKSDQNLSSVIDSSSPVLNRNRQKKPETVSSAIPSQLRLVSDLYDSLTESETSDENDETENDDPVIIDEIQNETDLFEMASLDEFNFEAYLNLRQGITSTPISKKNIDCSHRTPDPEVSIVKNNETEQYFTPKLIDKTNSATEGTSNTPMHKRKLVKLQIPPEKIQKMYGSTPGSCYTTCADVFEQDTVKRLERTEYFSQCSDSN